MRRVKAKDLEPDMTLLGYVNYEFYRSRTVLSVKKIPDGDFYEITTLGSSEFVTCVPEDRVYFVKEDSDDE